MWIKLISGNKTDFYTGKLNFNVGQVSAITDGEWNPNPECGGGIHFAKSIFTLLENTKHNGKGFLVEVEPIGSIIEFNDKAKAKTIIVKRIITPDEFIEELKADDPDYLNRRMRACKTEQWDTIFNFLK